MPVARFEPDGQVDVKALAEPLTFAFSERTTKNRLVKAAMVEMMSTWSTTDFEARGIPTKELIELYRRWGELKNGWGIILTGSVAIELDHLINAGDAAISLECPFHGERFEAFQALAAAGGAKGSLVIPQISHPGRQVQEHLQKNPISASAVLLGGSMTFALPRAATKADINRIIAGFAHAAQYLEKAGFDGVQLHGAHGYLIAQFLSQTTNRRTDEYGGSLANRARLLVEILRECRRRTSPSFVVGLKLNSVEFQEGGFTPQEAGELCAILEEGDVALDFIELSGGTYERLNHKWDRESTRKREAFFLEFAELIVPRLSTSGHGQRRKIKVFITGGLRTVPAMVRTLGVVDGVGLGRPACQEPRIAADIFEGRTRGAISPVAPFDSDTGMGLAAAGAQLRLIAKGREPFDLSDPAVGAHFQEDLAKHFGDAKPGLPDYSGETGPYGSGEFQNGL